MAASGGAIGLLLGGVLTDLASWPWALFINVPIGLGVIAVVPRVLSESVGSGNKLDVPGAVTATGGMLAMVYGLTNAATHAWTDTATIVSLAVSAVLLVAFVLIERRTAAPLLPFVPPSPLVPSVPPLPSVPAAPAAPEVPASILASSSSSNVLQAALHAHPARARVMSR